MKKITLVLSVLLLCAVMNAQQQVATLVHEGNVRVFYGEDAFVQAHGAAVSGDAISLSAGIYNSCDITKNIAIRGAGWRDANSNGTHFSSDVHIKIPTSDTVSNLSIEGIDFRRYVYVDSILRKPTIMKCYVDYLYFRGSFNGTILGSIIRNMFVNSVGNVSTTFINSIVVNNSGTNIFSNCSYINCILSFYYMSSFDKSTLESCIITSYTGSLSKSNVVTNCVSLNNTSTFYYLPQTNRYTTASNLFATVPDFNGSKMLTNITGYTYELTDSAKTTVVDANGSQVGIYGGAFPFTDKLNYPTITRMQVGKKATADGKLSVDIEVTTEDEE